MKQLIAALARLREAMSRSSPSASLEITALCSLADRAAKQHAKGAQIESHNFGKGLPNCRLKYFSFRNRNVQNDFDAAARQELEEATWPIRNLQRNFCSALKSRGR
ncbi:hypothetical protein [Mesorhizobium sp. BHbdii]